MLATAFIAAAALLPQALAHGGVLSYGFEGNWYFGWQPYNSPSGQSSIQRPWSSYNPIQDATASTLACNDDGSSPSGQKTATVSAGSPITAYWNQIWPHPYGPMLTYLAKCPGSSCDGVSASSLSWFKIDESGLLSGTVYNGKWASGKMIDQNSSWTSTIPSSVPSGPYLIRFETIAIHSLPAQMYPECAQINIINGGSLAPTSSELVKFPGAYSNSDPGLTTNLYSTQAQTQTTYQIPGPPLYAGAKGSGSSGNGGGSATATATTTKPATTSTSATVAPSSSSSSSSSSGAAHYGQCGGTGWSGPTTCVSPYTCTATNQYYSQCL
jgi:cellulase